MFYVFLIWLLATLVTTTLEFVFFSFRSPAFNLLQEVAQGAIPSPQERHLSHVGLSWTSLTIIGLIGFLIGYQLESHLRVIQRSYQTLQKRYPPFYQRIPADFRELWIAFAFMLPLFLLSLLLGLGMRLPLPILTLILFGEVAFGIGLALPPLMRFKQIQDLDRPEKPLRAVIHKVTPRFPLQISLVLGQIYLKLVLPVFSLFLVLLAPLLLEIITINSFQYLILFAGLLAGLGFAWYHNRASKLSATLFKQNLGQLSLLLIVITGFLLFGIQSENLMNLLIVSLSSGFLAGTY